jgi:hypothetical protein
MKKPLRFLFRRKLFATLLFLSAAAIYTLNSLPGEFESEESEREESAAEVLGPWDYMGSMRSWPNPNGEISAAKYVEAFEHMKRMPVAKTNRDPRARVQAPSPWVPLGPMNFAGRVLSLAFHPTDPNTMWCGAASGGLWKTTNGGYGTAGGGINWTQVQTGFPVTSVPAIAVNPTNANEIFIGTGEVYNTGTSTGFPGQNIRTFRGSYGIGILKSSDGGTTWSSSLPFTNSAVKGVTHILYRPGTPTTIFAATSDGVYRSTDAGTSWSLVLNVPLAMDMDFSPGRPDTLYVTCGVFNSAGSGIYRCTNSSAASPTFTQLTSGLPASANINGMTRLSICPDNRDVIYAAVGKIPGTGGGTAAPTAGATFGLYKSTNAGNSWAATGAQPQLSGTHYIAGQGWYAHDVLAGTDASQRVIAAEIDMLRSTNGGGAWTQISQWNLWDFSATGTTVGDPTEGVSNNQDYVHADIHRLYLSPHDATNNTIFVVSDGGVFRSTDGGTNFNSLNGGLMTAQIYHKMSVHPTNSNLMLCGLQDNATLLYEGSTGCRRTMGGDGFYTAIDQTDPNYCYGTYTYGTWYNSTTGPTGGFGGATWTNTMNGATSTPNENAAFVAPVVLAPSNPNRLYVGTIYLRRFSNPRAGNTQLAVGNGGAAISGANNPIMAIGVSQTFADSIYIATAPGGANPGRMYRSTNGGTSVTNITGTLPNRYFSYIAVDPTNSQRVAVSVSGFGTSHVYFSSNGGGTWNDIGGVGGTALPDVPANVVMFDPTTPTTLYVGTDIGVFVAQNITTGSTQPTWYSYNDAWTDVTPVMDLLVAPNGKLRAGTFGKGLWENNMVTGSLPVTFQSFTATPSQAGNQLKWVIGTQESVSHYEVEYSTDGINFRSVATVQARSGSANLTYDFTHKITNTVKGYYRIKVVDIDGQLTYSQVEEVKATSGVVKISVYPNPTTGNFKIRIPSQLSGTVELSIYDDIGRLVISDRLQISSTTEVPMDISRLAAGSYQIICENRSVKYVTRIVKK